jgi:hypothetical protein
VNQAVIEEYPVQTMNFYASCINTRQLNTVVALTGGMKTFFLLNLVLFATMVELPVCFVNLQMHINEVQRRIRAMAHNQSLWHVMQGALTASSEVLEQLKRIGYVDLQGSRLITAAQVASAMNLAIRKLGKPVLILVDGLESMAEYNREKMDEVVAHLGNIAAEKEACIWMSAQGSRQSDGQEIFGIPAIAETSSKAQISSQVIALGPRIDNQLLTASRPKARNGPGQFGSVVRLVVRPSLRLELFETVGTPIHLAALPESTPAPTFINIDECEAQLDRDISLQDEAEENCGSGIGATPPLKPYHGHNGWVGIGRAVFASPLFTNRNTDYAFWMVDLYQQAHFEPGSPYAPDTNHPVRLKRGQVMTSVRMLAKRWGVTRKKVETFLVTAEREGLISVETEYKTHREPQGAPATEKPRKGPKEKKFCSVITLLHYGGKKETHEE